MNDLLENPKPPRWATRLLEWYCAPHLLEEVHGDLLEEFEYQVKKSGYKKARRDYIRSVFGFIKPFAIKRKKTHQTPTISMNLLRHYFIVTTRNITRQKAFSAINVMGLALGITCCLFIFLWIQDERAMDNFHSKGDRLYNVYETVTTNNIVSGSYAATARRQNNRTYFPIADAPAAIPEIEAVNIYATGYELPWGYPETFQVGDKKQKFEGSRATENFFTMFDYIVVAGVRDHALKDLSSIAISRKMAEIFFKSPEDAIGKSIRYENRLDFTVVTVFENVTVHSSLKFDFLINWESHVTRLNWATPYAYSTILVKEGSDVKDIEEKLNRLVQSHLDPNDPRKVKLGLQKFGDQYLYGTFRNGKPEAGRATYVNIFIGVGAFILLIACINFMNLATARSVKRAKEIGIRKVVGSSRAGLIWQFLGEAIVLSAIASLLSVMFVYALLPTFNTFTSKHIQSPFNDPALLAILAGLTIAVGFIAGSYPALFLSSLRPVKIFRSELKFTGGTVTLRQGLSVFQFMISIVLLIVTMVITLQTRYVQNTQLGYDRENLLYMRLEGSMGDFNDNGKNYRTYELFKQRAMAMPGIAMVDRSSEAPHAMGFVVDENDGKTETADDNDAIHWEGKEKGQSVGFKPASVGFDFLKIMKLEVVEGRGFSREIASDSADAFMVNEEAVKQMGMKDPIGKWISAWAKKGHIIGILKDYHTHSLHEPIKPLIIDVKEYEYFGVILVRTEPGKTEQALSSLQKLYREVNPEYPFSYQFVDEEYGRFYRNEQVISSLSNVFALLAIAISCLGILGLAMFSAEQRTREFGIRKVLGASIANIVRLMSTDFIKLILVAFGIAVPIAFLLMQDWLRSFAYHINMSWWIFVIAGITAMLVALLTISLQAIRAAVANPVDSLRSE